MISIVGLGNAASAIADKFSDASSNYNIYLMNSKFQRSSKQKLKLKKFETPEEYETNIPNVKQFFKGMDDHVQFIIMGASYSSNYALGILEQIKDKKIDVFYIKPDIDLLTGVPRLVERAVFGILQEYARSGLLNSITLFSNLELENILKNVPVKDYYDTLNTSIFSTMHYLNFFEHTEPEIGQISKPGAINRIRSVAILNMKTLEEKWCFPLDIDRELCYYMCINEKRMREEGGLHKKLVNILKEKPRNAFRKISYAIYETSLEQDFGFCISHTNAIQNNT
jgi:hypothetical protein